MTTPETDDEFDDAPTRPRLRSIGDLTQRLRRRRRHKLALAVTSLLAAALVGAAAAWFLLR